MDWVRFWEFTAADWAGLQFAILTVAALVALRQAKEARRQREEQARPFVVVDLDVGNTIAEFRITNIGKTVARNVRFEFNPPLESSWDGDAGHIPLAETNLLKQGIPSLPPGKVVHALFDQLPSRIGKGLPDDYKVQVSYEDALGKKHSEPMTVGYSHLREIGRLQRRDVHDIHKEIKDIGREIRKWTVLGRAIRVMTPEDVENYRREREEQYAEREAEAAAQAETEEGTKDEVEQLGPTGFEVKDAPSGS